MSANLVEIGKILEIYYCPTNGGDVKPSGVRMPMIKVETISAETDMGLSVNGIPDRYNQRVKLGFWNEADRKKGQDKLRQVSIVTKSALDRFGQNSLMSRRNLIADVDPDKLLSLLLQEATIAIGLQVLLKIERDCDACNRPSRLNSGVDDFKNLGTLGGVRARIITGGDIHVDDIISINNTK